MSFDSDSLSMNGNDVIGDDEIQLSLVVVVRDHGKPALSL